MGRRRKGRMQIIIAVIFFLMVILSIAFVRYFYVQRSIGYEKTDSVLNNPYMGFVVNADYPSAVEYSNCTLVYVDITWREWEPEEGQYAFKQVWEDNYLGRWQEEGKKIVLRFVCDFPEDEEHMDIPDWLYEQTGDGVFYDVSYGKGYAPEYSNTTFIEKHRNAILALGEAFEESGMVVYVQLGSLGHWGEWHMKYTEGTTRMPSSEIREEYVAAYEEAFPYAHLLTRRPFPENESRDIGLYNDMSGHPESTDRWLNWILEGGEYSQPVVEEELIPQPDVWNSAPIGGEFTSSLDWEDMLVENLEKTVELFEASHTTFIGPKVPVREEVEEYGEGVEAVLKTIGYRYSISEMNLSYWKWAEEGTLTLTVENSGIAPIYFQRDLYIGIYDENGKQVDKIEVPVDLMKITGGSAVSVAVGKVPVVQGYTYTVWAQDPETGKPDIYLDMDCENADFEYKILAIDKVFLDNKW